MPYVERSGGAISSLYANPQPGRAAEFVPDDSPEVVAFRAEQRKTPDRPKAPPAPTGNSIAALRAEVAALRQALVDAGLLAP